MARWQLTEPHYLNSPGNFWEFETKNRKTGRSERKQFPVPIHLDPNIEGDWNHTDKVGNNIIDGKIIVCWADKGEDNDIIFDGPPTPGMLPIDDEAKEISGGFAWKPTRGLDEGSQFDSYAQQMLIKFTEELRGVGEQSKTTSIQGMDEFMKTMAEMARTQTQLLAALVGKKVDLPEAVTIKSPELTEEEELARIAKGLGLKPIIDTEKPLPAPAKTFRRA